MKDWTRVTKRRPCPVCNQDHWCTIGDTVICCMRVESSRRCSNGGWLHPLGSSSAGGVAYHQGPARPTRQRSVGINWGALVELYVKAVQPKPLAQLAALLGVTVPALRALDIGWDGEAWVMPERRPDRQVCGIKRRTSPQKLYVNGSAPGLYIPRDLNGSEPLFICEGGSDTAALWGLGVSVIGRPNCNGGTRYVCEMARGRRVVLVPDNDPVNQFGHRPGQEGAATLSKALRGIAASVKTVIPPVKDSREWVRAGLTREELLRLV